MSRVDVLGRGSQIRRDRSLRVGANVNFLSPGSDGSWRVRTYERGVEAETLACGTGTVGAAFALAARNLAALPVRIASWGGNVFSVAGRIEGGRAVAPWLCGEGRLVFEGTLQ